MALVKIRRPGEGAITAPLTPPLEPAGRPPVKGVRRPGLRPPHRVSPSPLWRSTVMHVYIREEPVELEMREVDAEGLVPSDAELVPMAFYVDGNQRPSFRAMLPAETL